MILSNDEKRIFTLIVDEYKRNSEQEKISLQNIAEEINLTQDEFVLAISSLQANTLIQADPNFATVSLLKKGLNNINYITGA